MRNNLLRIFSDFVLESKNVLGKLFPVFGKWLVLLFGRNVLFDLFAGLVHYLVAIHYHSAEPTGFVGAV